MGAPRWVAVMNGIATNQVYVSTDGRAWTTASAQIGTGGDVSLLSIVNFKGVWIAGGQLSRAYWTNDPNSAWTSVLVAGSASNTVNQLAVGGGYIVAGYTSGTGIAYATDPTGTWSAPTSSGFTAGVASVGYLNGYFLASYRGIRYTTDPTGTWSSATLSPTTAGNTEGQWAYGLASDGTAYYVHTADNSSTSPRIYYATDPTATWTGTTASFTSTVVRGLAYANGYFVAGGVGEIRWATAPNGTWTAATTPGLAGYVLGITYRDGLWVATGSSGTSGSQRGQIYYTTDPTGTWTQGYQTGALGSNYFIYASMALGGRDSRVSTRSAAVARAASW